MSDFSVGLYPKLLGAQWNNLHPALQRLHGSGKKVAAAGIFQVSWGRWPARVVAWLLRMPSPGNAVPVCLTITPADKGENWHRTFAGKPLVTWQEILPSGDLAEHLGGVVVRLRVSLRDGGLQYDTLGASCRLGRWAIPLPRWLSPHITAWEGIVGTEEQPRVRVEVMAPGLGRLVTYLGVLEQVELQA